MTITAYPLTWPDTLPRTKAKVSSQFRTGLSAALKNVNGSLAAFARDSSKPIKREDITISSNVTLGADKPSDPGVAVWFVWDGLSVCIAVDRYPKVEDNLQAIHHVLEARRTELRHGGLHIVRATFMGFQALPAPNSSCSWREILEIVTSGPITEANIEAAYRRLAKKHHPDLPEGSGSVMTELNNARDQALKEVRG